MHLQLHRGDLLLNAPLFVAQLRAPLRQLQ
jgi:hypothetical protein